MTVLDLELLKPFQAPGMFTRVDPAVEALLVTLPEVRDRVAGCVEFCYALHSGRLIGFPKNGIGGPTEEELKERRKYLRAALAEFAAMDDAALVDFSDVNGRVPPRMKDSADPRIHVLRLLRHANVHLSATKLSHSSRSAVWEGPDGWNEFEYSLILADDISASVLATDNAKRYGSDDLNAMLAWLDTEQREWGIDHTVLRGAELYASIIADAL